MLYAKEFPDYDGELYLPKGFEDVSYHNDLMPHCRLLIDVDDTKVEFNIWQDYVDAEKREYYDDRYHFQINVGGEDVFDYGTENIEEIKRLVRCIQVEGIES